MTFEGLTRTSGGYGFTPQTVKSDERQVRNNAGGMVFKVEPLDRIRRFLVLGSDKNYYSTREKLTVENVECISAYLAGATVEEQCQLINMIVAYSVEGRAAKQSPGILALALVITDTRFDTVKAYGYQAMPKVCRTGSTFLEFFGYLSKFQRFGMGTRKAIGRWYTSQDINRVAYQVVKYRNRSGFTHRDLLRLSKRVKTDLLSESAWAALVSWITEKPYEFEDLPQVVQGFEKAKTASAEELPDLIRYYRLGWEMVPSARLKDPVVWKTFLVSGTLPLGALTRNLGRMTAIGVFEDREALDAALIRFSDEEYIRKSRMHPLNLLVALKVYEQGHGEKGALTWRPNQRIVQALDRAVYMSYGNVEATGKRFMYGLDISVSMQSYAGGTLLSSYEAEAMLAMVTAAVEPECLIVGFAPKGGRLAWGDSTDLKQLPLKGMRLTEAMKEVTRHGFGMTDLSLPMEYALSKKIPVDVFVIVTDNETYWGRQHPHEALAEYRAAMGIDAKLVVLATTSSNFTIALPDDPGMLDIAGFDLTVPQVIAGFAQE